MVGVTDAEMMRLQRTYAAVYPILFTTYSDPETDANAGLKTAIYDHNMEVVMEVYGEASNLLADFVVTACNAMPNLMGELLELREKRSRRPDSDTDKEQDR